MSPPPERYEIPALSAFRRAHCIVCIFQFVSTAKQSTGALELHGSPKTAPDLPTQRRRYMKTTLTGYDLLIHPRLNKGTAFTDSERDAFGLHGLLPPHVGTLEEQRKRRKAGLDNEATPLQKYTFYAGSPRYQRNSVLFANHAQHRGYFANCLYPDRRRSLPAIQWNLA